MAHSPKPFFKPNRSTWYCEIARVQHVLGKHPADAGPPRRKPAPAGRKEGDWDPPPAILAAFYKLMAAGAEKPRPAAGPAPGQLVIEVLDEFLTWCEKHKAPLTFAWYRDRIQAFVRTVPGMTVSDLKPIHVERWVDAHPGWSASHQRGSKVAVQRAFRWAEKMGVVKENPIRHIDKPEQGKREKVITPQEYEALLARFTDSFGDLIRFAWNTGCRPQESVRIEARHVDLANRRITLPPREAKGKKRYRVIYLNDAALALVTRLTGERSCGPIFRNAGGDPWTAWAVNCRFNRLQEHTGREKLGRIVADDEEVKALAAMLTKTRTVKGVAVVKSERALLGEARKKLRTRAARKAGQKLCLYNFRHTFANRLLAAGVDSLTVSTLLGHVDGTMLGRVYSHLQQNSEHLLDAVNRVTPPDAAA